VSAVHRIGAITAHELRLARRDPASLMVLLVFPIITTAFLKPAFRAALVETVHPHANGAEHVVPGQAVMSAFFIVSLVTLAFYSEHSWATWDRLRASRATSFEIVAGKALPRIAIVIAQLVLLLVAGVLVFDMRIGGDAWALAPLIVAFSICLVFLGVCVTALCRTAQQAGAFAYLGMVLFGAIGGAFVPIDLLPTWARVVAPVTPTYWAMRGMRSVVLDGRGVGSIALPSAVLLGMSVVFALVALRRLRFDETKTGWN
jgi:ABC-2 type transport system permease protein